MAIVHLVPGNESSYVELLDTQDTYELIDGSLVGVGVEGWACKPPEPELGDWVIGILTPEQLIMDTSTEMQLTGSELAGDWNWVPHPIRLADVRAHAGLPAIRLPARLSGADADRFLVSLKHFEDRRPGSLEGRRRSSSTRARSASNRRWVWVRSTGVCPCCGRDSASQLDGRGRRALEVHHLNPLGSCEEAVATTPAELACVCATCHRLLHVGVKDRALLHPDELRELLDPDAPVRCPLCGSNSVKAGARVCACTNCENRWHPAGPQLRSRRRRSRS